MVWAVRVPETVKLSAKVVVELVGLSAEVRVRLLKVAPPVVMVGERFEWLKVTVLFLAVKVPELVKLL